MISRNGPLQSLATARARSRLTRAPPQRIAARIWSFQKLHGVAERHSCPVAGYDTHRQRPEPREVGLSLGIGDGQCNQLHSRPAFEVPQPVGRPRAAPRGREISWPQCVLRRPCRRDWNGLHGSHGSGLVRSKLLAEKLIENFSTYLRALAERDSGLRSGDARFRLPLAEMLDLCHDVLGRQEGLARTDLRLRRGLRTDVWQQDQNDTQPEYHSQDEPHSPALFPGGSVTSSVFLPTNLNREWSTIPMCSA